MTNLQETTDHYKIFISVYCYITLLCGLSVCCVWQVEKENKEELMFQSDSENDSCDEENSSNTLDSKPTAPEESNMSR